MAEKREPGKDLPTDVIVGDHVVGGMPPVGEHQHPSIGRIVIYRNRAGIDMPAIVTEVTDPTEGLFVHLHIFPPPGQAADPLTDREWGWPHESQVVGVATGCWRWPERQG